MGRRSANSCAYPVPLIDFTITINNNTATLNGVYPVDIIRKLTSYAVDGAYFSTAYRRQRWNPEKGIYERAWDGRTHLFNLRTQSMPPGLVSFIKQSLLAVNPQAVIEIHDERNIPVFTKNEEWDKLDTIEFGVGKYDYQKKAAVAAIQGKQGILKLSTNSGKSAVAAAVTKYLRLPTIYIVPSVDLLYQTSRHFSQYLSLDPKKIGMIGDGHFDVQPWITFAVVDTLYSRMEMCKEWLQNKWQVMFADECHSVGASTVFDVLDNCNATWRVGLSGTPLDRTDGADLKLIAQTGDILYEVTNKELIDRGISVPACIEVKKITTPLVFGNNYKDVHTRSIVKNDFLNKDIINWVPEQVKNGKQVVILVKEINHGKHLETELKKIGTGYQFIHGEDTSDVRLKALKDFNSGDVKCLIGTSILYQGIDTPNIDILVFADLGKSKIVVLQAIGRGLRQRAGKDKLLVRDYANFCHKWMAKHALKRIQMYRAEGCFTFSVIP